MQMTNSLMNSEEVLDLGNYDYFKCKIEALYHHGCQ